MNKGKTCKFGRVVALSTRQALVEISAERCQQCPKSGCQSVPMFQAWFHTESSMVLPRGCLRLGQGVKLLLDASIAELAVRGFAAPLIGLLLGIVASAQVRSALGVGIVFVGLAAGLALNRIWQPQIVVEPL